jgi:hypothetical protein
MGGATSGRSSCLLLLLGRFQDHGLNSLRRFAEAGTPTGLPAAMNFGRPVCWPDVAGHAPACEGHGRSRFLPHFLDDEFLAHR